MAHKFEEGDVVKAGNEHSGTVIGHTDAGRAIVENRDGIRKVYDHGDLKEAV